MCKSSRSSPPEHTSKSACGVCIHKVYVMSFAIGKQVAWEVVELPSLLNEYWLRDRGLLPS